MATCLHVTRDGIDTLHVDVVWLQNVLFTRRNFSERLLRASKPRTFYPCSFIFQRSVPLLQHAWEKDSEAVKETKYSQTSVHERLGSRTIRFTNKFSEHKASRITYCVSSYELWSRVEWCQETEKRKRIPFQPITFHFLTTFHLRRQLSSIPVR